MYEKGDLIIYGNQSVCRVENIGVISIGNQPNERVYYTLNPIFIDGMTYAPVDTPVYMRPLISLDEVNQLLETICDVEADMMDSQNLKQLTEYYKDTLNEYTCGDLIQLICNVKAKKEALAKQNKKLGQTDERYKKEAEDLLHQEFAAVLDISKDEVIEFIQGKVKVA